MNLIDEKYSLLCIIVDFQNGSKILKEAKKLGVTGGTFFLGKGTVDNYLLDILGLNEIRKEILMMIINEELEDTIFDELNRKFSFNKPNHGISFSMPIKSCIGLKNFRYIPNPEKRGVNNMQYEAIFTITDKGLSDKVLEAAKSAGSTGGTVIHGRGSGTKENARLFNIEIEPEKEIVLILSTIEKTESIVNSIKEKLNINHPGKGIIFVLDVNKALGLFEK